MVRWCADGLLVGSLFTGESDRLSHNDEGNPAPVEAVVDACRVRRNVGAPLAAFGLATQPGYPVKKGVNSKADPIRTDIWDSQAGSTQAVLVS